MQCISFSAKLVFHTYCKYSGAVYVDIIGSFL